MQAITVRPCRTGHAQRTVVEDCCCRTGSWLKLPQDGRKFQHPHAKQTYAERIAHKSVWFSGNDEQDAGGAVAAVASAGIWHRESPA